MRASSPISLLAVLASSLWAPVVCADTTRQADSLELLQSLNDQAIEALGEAEAAATKRSTGRCSISNAAVRKDWLVDPCSPPSSIACLLLQCIHPRHGSEMLNF